MSQPTVADKKQAFLRRQKQILTRGIAPSTRLLTIAEEAGIQIKVLHDVMNKLDRDVKRHGREVYSRQMTDHIVEQIDLLYWEAGAPTIDAEKDLAVDTGPGESHTLYQGDDLTLDKHISKLPVAWDTSETSQTALENEGEEIDQDMYIHAAARLQDLSAQRLTLQQKLNTYRTLLSLLEPYRKPQENIQPNLVGKDAPLAPELAKTRTLAIRVAGRIGEKYGDVQVPSTAEDADIEMMDDNVKLQKILAGW